MPWIKPSRTFFWNCWPLEVSADSDSKLCLSGFPRVCGVFTCLTQMSSSYCNIVIYWPCSCPKCAGPGHKKEVQVARWRHDALVTTWKSPCYCNHESASSASLTIYIYICTRQSFQQASEQLPTKALFHFRWCLMVLYYLWHETCGFNVELKLNTQNMMTHSCIWY